MFSELLNTFHEVMKTSKNSSRQLSKIITQAKNELGIVQTSISAQHPTALPGAAISFPKAERFKPLEKQQTLDSSSLTTDQFIQPKNTYSFSQSDRFPIEKHQQLTPIAPNYDFIKKNTSVGGVICKDLKNSRLSVSTAATETSIGPSSYFPQDVLAPKKNTAFAKGKRFQKEKKKYQDIPLHPNHSYTKKRPPTAAILKPATLKTKHIISRDQQEQFRQRLKMLYWQSIPLQIDRIYRNHPSGPILKDKFFNIQKMKGRQKRCAMLMLLDRLHFQRGGFEQNIAKDLVDVPCAAVYRKSTPKQKSKPFYPEQPGPDYYYPRDDLLKPTTQGFTFAHDDQSLKKTIYDTRDYTPIDPSVPNAPNPIINPEHKPHRLTSDQIKALERGPGFYDSIFKLVEKRDDAGVVAYQPLKEGQARQDQIIQVKQVVDAMYFPKYTAIDPNTPAPLYKPPASIQPIHTPQKLLFPEHWLFYDGDLNKVRAQVAKNVLLAKGMTFKEYQRHALAISAFKAYMTIGRKIPEGGDYNVSYKVLDPHIAVVDFNKQQQKNLLDPIVKLQGDVDGDNLILQPKGFDKHQPNVDFKKMVGRPEEQVNLDGNILILDPKIPQNHIATPNIALIPGRVDPEPTFEGDNLILNPTPIPTHIPAPNIQKQVPRPQPNQPKQQEVVLDPKPIQKKVKGHVSMERMSSVRLVPYLRKLKQSSIAKKK